ncbi:MAG: hypothetical protein JW822_07380 [Spirochaetales bacterium]|nr:hypothetical protein [Spirochaetales bacterium]
MQKTMRMNLFYPLIAVCAFVLCQTIFAQTPCPDSDNLIISWLQNRTTVEQAEADNMVTLEDLGPDPVPFGYINEQWQEFLAQMREGDELWEFESPPETWDNLAGRKGIALIRDCEVVALIVTLMN